MTFTAKNTDWGKNDCAVIVGKDKVTQVEVINCDRGINTSIH